MHSACAACSGPEKGGGGRSGRASAQDNGIEAGQSNRRCGITLRPKPLVALRFVGARNNTSERARTNDR